jgi:hypothetical protein
MPSTRTILALVGLLGVLSAFLAIALIPVAIGQRAKPNASAAPLSPTPGEASDGWTLTASSPTNAPLALGGTPFGRESSASQHAWMLVRGARPPERASDRAASGEGAIAEPPKLSPDLRQPAVLLHIAPAEGSGAAAGSARTLAVFPSSPDAMASTGSRIVLAFVDHPDVTRLPVPPVASATGQGQTASAPVAAPSSRQPTPPLRTTVVEYRAVASTSSDAWQLASGVRQLAPLPPARPVIAMAFGTPLDGAGVVAREPVLFALLGPALDNPSRAPNTELYVLDETGWQTAGQPWKEPALLPTSMASVPGGVALVCPHAAFALVASLPAPDEAPRRTGWLKLKEDEDWTVGRQAGGDMGPKQPLAERLVWRELPLPAIAAGDRHAQLLWAGDQLVLLTERGGTAEGGEPAGAQTLVLSRLAASGFASAFASGMTDGLESSVEPAWALLAELAPLAMDGPPPHMLGVPGVARLSLVSPTSTTSPLGIVPHEAIQVSLATGLEFARGPLPMTPPATGADVRLFGFAIAYALGMIAITLAPRPAHGLVLPLHASMASPARRFTAGLLDFLIAVVLGSLLVGVSPAEVATSSIEDLLLTREGQGVMLAILGVAVLFNASLESLTGRSVGKFLCGIGVARLVPAEAGLAGAEDGMPSNSFLAPPLHKSLVRNLVKWCLFPLGFIAALRPGASHKGDDLAQCAVIDPTVDEEE